MQAIVIQQALHTLPFILVVVILWKEIALRLIIIGTKDIRTDSITDGQVKLLMPMIEAGIFVNQ